MTNLKGISVKKPKLHGWELDVRQTVDNGSFFELEEYSSVPSRKITWIIKPVSEQVAILKKFLPKLSTNIDDISEIIDYSEGFLVMPKFNKIGKNYNDSLGIVLNILRKERSNLINFRKGELKKDYLRLTSRTEEAYKQLNSQKGDLFVIPVQMGYKHRGRSARRDYILLKPNEFLLGPLEVTVFLLTHPEWLSSDKEFGIDAAGCEYGPYGHNFFKYILFFYFFNGNLKFSDRWSGCPDGRFGPATGFLPRALHETNSS